MVMMQNSLVSILLMIEALRKEMHQVADLKGLSHPDVLRTSQKLDKKINEYNRIVYS